MQKGDRVRVKTRKPINLFGVIVKIFYRGIAGSNLCVPVRITVKHDDDMLREWDPQILEIVRE